MLRASSAATLQKALAVLDGGLDEHADATAEALYGVTDLVKTESSLRRALTDPARSTADKQELARNVFTDTVPPVVLQVLEAVASGRWSDDRDLITALEELADNAVLVGALRHGTLDQVEKELFSLHELLAQERSLRNTLADSRGASPQRRADLAQSVFGDRLSPATMRLLRRVVGTVESGQLQAALRDLSARAAAVRQHHLVTVHSAAELTPDQYQRLVRIIENAYGTGLTIHTAIDPGLVGGMRIKIGSQVVDGTVLATLAETRRRLVG